MTTTDREMGTRRLRALRVARGWSWADLARALNQTARQLAVPSVAKSQVVSIQRTVARWESATDSAIPGDRYQLLLAHLYARTSAGDVAVGPGSDFDALLDALRHLGTSQRRVQQLVELISRDAHSDDGELLTLLPPEMQSSLTAVQCDPSAADHGLVRRLHESVTAINEQVGTTPFVRLQLQLAPIVAACRRLLKPDHNGPTNDLILLATATYALAGRLAFETRDDETAMAFYADATTAAGRFADKSHRAAVRTSHTMVRMHATNDPEAAREIARAATIDAHRGSSYAIRARAHAVHAEICARAGQSAEAAAALDRAWKTVEQLSSDDPYGGFTTDRLHGFDGLCALHVGDPNHAHDSLTRSATTLHMARDAVQRGIVNTDLALARIRLGDPAAGADLLHEAVNITAATGGRVPAQRIRMTRRHLRPWRTETFVTELDDHIHDTLIGR